MMIEESSDWVNSSPPLSIQPIVEGSSPQNLTEKAGQLARDLFTFAKEHPKTTFTASALTVLLALGYAFYRGHQSVERPATPEILVAHCDGLSETERTLAVQSYANRVLNSVHPCFNNERNLAFLYQKIAPVLASNIAQEQKITILRNIEDNFYHFTQESRERIERDLEEEPQFRALFSIQSDLVSAEIAGEESHNRGRVAICFTFSGGEKVMYKPRSCHSERLICGDEPRSLFHELGLPTHKVCERGDYGYTQFLAPQKSDNTFHNSEELVQYARECGRIELAARALLLSDLHKQNLLIVSKHCFLIDTEVVALPPTHFTTGFLGEESSPFQSSGSESGLFLSPSLIEVIATDLEVTPHFVSVSVDSVGLSGLFEQDRGIIAEVQAAARQEEPDFVAHLNELAPECRVRLAEHRNRIVLIETSNLKVYINESLEASLPAFLDELEEGVEKLGFTPHPELRAVAAEPFRQDFLNNDVPIFYHDSREGALYYGGREIGRVAASSSSSSSSPPPPSSSLPEGGHSAMSEMGSNRG